MKTKNFQKKLSLNKVTVSELGNTQLMDVCGGALLTVPVEINTQKCNWSASPCTQGYTCGHFYCPVEPVETVTPVETDPIAVIN